MIRPASSEDYRSVAALFPELGAPGDPTPSEERFRGELMARMFVAELAIEDDERLSRALVDAGAEIVLRTLHMAGPLPGPGIR